MFRIDWAAARPPTGAAAVSQPVWHRSYFGARPNFTRAHIEDNDADVYPMSINVDISRNAHRPLESGNATGLGKKVSAKAKRPRRPSEVISATDDGLIVDQVAISNGAVRGSILNDECPALVLELRIGNYGVPDNEDDRRRGRVG